MSIFNVLSLFGGLAMFLYGMNVMGDGLAKTAGGKLEVILEKLTSTAIKGVLLGAAVTAVIQSSSATTVMVVGFVNSGIMKLRQAVGIIMGANIGTTVTSWILSLSGIEGDSVFIKLLKPSSFAPILAVVGIIFIMFTKNEKKHDIGQILLGFTVLMFGMDAMSSAVAPLADVPGFTNMLLLFSNPVLGMLAGALLTAIIQSSSASVGILQALCITGAVPYSVAIPIILGQNIGTCVTALISSIGAKKNARRAAFVHLYFNVIGTIAFMLAFYTINLFAPLAFLNTAANAAGIAVIHSLFNITATICLLPFGKGLEKLATITVRDKETETDVIEELAPLKRLDERFLEKPAFAVVQGVDVIKTMAGLSKEAAMLSVSMIEQYTEDTFNKVTLLEDVIDTYEDELGSYMVNVSGRELSRADSHRVSMGLHVIGDLEQISDNAMAVAEICSKMKKKQIKFSEKALTELKIYTAAISDIMDMTMKAVRENDFTLASRIEPFHEAIEGLTATIKRHHIKRLQKGKCTVELGIVLENMTNNFGNMAHHCSNIAVALLQENSDSFDTHEYLEMVKQEKNVEFIALYQMYRDKYSI